MKPHYQALLDTLPSKQYFGIGEVADFCNLKASVLRYWEKEFVSLNPMKRNNRRSYQKVDIVLVLKLKDLLHNQRYSIQGAREFLEKEKNAVNTKDVPLIDENKFAQEVQFYLDTIKQINQQIIKLKNI